MNKLYMIIDPTFIPADDSFHSNQGSSCQRTILPIEHTIGHMISVSIVTMCHHDKAQFTY